MSKLTEFQIRAMVVQIEATARRYEAAGKKAAAKKALERLERYRQELQAYEAREYTDPNKEGRS